MLFSGAPGFVTLSLAKHWWMPFISHEETFLIRNPSRGSYTQFESPKPVDVAMTWGRKKVPVSLVWRNNLEKNAIPRTLRSGCLHCSSRDPDISRAGRSRSGWSAHNQQTHPSPNSDQRLGRHSSRLVCAMLEATPSYFRLTKNINYWISVTWVDLV